MSERSIHRRMAAVAALTLGLGVGACETGYGINQAWTGPGWYLQKPYLTVGGGPMYFGGPWTYDKCEEERIKLPAETATQMLCIRENRKPDRYGLY